MNPTPLPAQLLDRGIEIAAAERHMLDAFAAIVLQIFLDLALVVGGLVDGNADLAARAGHGARDCRPVSLPSMLKNRISRKLNSRS